MIEQRDFRAFTACPLEENMLHIKMKKVDKLSAKDIEQIHDCYFEIGKGSKVYTLITFQGFIPISYEAIKAAVKNRKAQNIYGANAYVVDNLALRMGISFFINFHDHKHPVAIFSTELEALSWLREKKIKDRKKAEVF